jgi:hypothetical protein
MEQSQGSQMPTKERYINFQVEAKYPLIIFKDNGLECSWNTVKVGWDLKRLTTDEIGNFAVSYLEACPSLIDQYISELIFGIKAYEMNDYLRKIFDSLHLSWPEEGSSVWDQEWRKWRFCILSTMVKNITDEQELLATVEGLYADFGYPKDMEPFIYYMPQSDENAGLTPNEACQLLIKKIINFLAEEKALIESGCSQLPKRIY